MRTNTAIIEQCPDTALIAIVGKPKWDPAQTGWRRLTPSGRLTILLAALALFASFALTLRAQRDADVHRTQRERINKVAHTEIRLALQGISGWFVQVACPGPWMWPACMLEDSGRASLAEATTVGHGNSLDTVKSIRDGANRGSAELDRTLQIYAAYLDDDVLASLSELRHSEYLFRVVHSEANTDFLDVPPDQRKYYPPDFLGYEKFWRLVVKLDQRLTRDDSNPGLWGPEYAHRGGGSENKTERKAP